MKIQTIDIDTYRLRRRYHEEVIPEEIPQIKEYKKGRQYTARKGHNAGVNSQRTISQFMYLLLYRNEIEAMKGTPLTRPQLLHNLEIEFPRKRFEHLKSHRITFGTYHNKYNLAALYEAQPRPILLSLRYDEQGYVVESSRASSYMTFDQCRELCAKYQIADPRFFSFAELTQMRKNLSLDKEPWKYWSIPNNEEVLALEKKASKKPYLSLKYPPGLGLQETVEQL